jgi:diaminopimelate decarboxylase/aspartate kinase
MDNKWLVMKFGGTSQCVSGYHHIKKIINEYASVKINLVIVLSAVKDVTNCLEKYVKNKDIHHIKNALSINDKLHNDLGLFGGKMYTEMKRRLDYDITRFETAFSDDDDELYDEAKILGYGEFLSTAILYDFLNNDKISYISAYDFIKSTTEVFKLYPLAEFYGDLEIFNKKLKKNDHKVVITQGFVASSPLNKTILLGRGGSDTTGALIAQMLDAIEYQVWTDVDGIFTADPRLVPSAKLIHEIDGSVVQELAAMGAKVMHPASILPCSLNNIPIVIKNTFNPYSSGTIIHNFKPNDKLVCMSLQKDISLFEIETSDMWKNPGIAGDILDIFGKNQVDVDIISTSQFVVMITTEEKNKSKLNLVHEILGKKENYDIKFHKNCSIISVIAQDIRNIFKYFGEFKDINFLLSHFSANKMCISFVVNDDPVKLINDIHKKIIA